MRGASDPQGTSGNARPPEQSSAGAVRWRLGLLGKRSPRRVRSTADAPTRSPGTPLGAPTPADAPAAPAGAQPPGTPLGAPTPADAPAAPAGAQPPGTPLGAPTPADAPAAPAGTSPPAPRSARPRRQTHRPPGRHPAPRHPARRAHAGRRTGRPGRRQPPGTPLGAPTPADAPAAPAGTQLPDTPIQAFLYVVTSVKYTLNACILLAVFFGGATYFAEHVHAGLAVNIAGADLL